MLTWLEIDTKAIQFNLKQFRKIIGPDVLLMPVIKANAYGHGFLEIAKICQQNREVDRICVVNSDEALRLTRNRIHKPIQILSFYDFDDKILLELANPPSAFGGGGQIIFPLYTHEQAKILNKIGERAKTKIKTHIKIDVGASRVGILPKDAVEFINKIKKLKNIDIEGIWSHFSSSEDNREVTQQQLNIFNDVLLKLKEQKIDPPLKHLACSAAAILYPTSRLGAARIGISLYGLYPSKQTVGKINLKPALSWHTKVIQVKNVPSGTKIGYDGAYTVNRPTKLAVLPVGYWDGFDRGLSNRGQVLIKGYRCPILGRVCMNLTMVDVTGLAEVKIGDEITLLGEQKRQKITAEDMASWAGTINYEIIDRINPLLPRIYKGY